MANPTTTRPDAPIRRRGLFAIGALTAAAALTALTLSPPADAAANRPSAARQGEETAPRQAGEPVMAIVSIKSQRVTIYDADGWMLRAPVSTGIKGRETPAGVFSVVEKDKDHHSNLYDDAWMPNMLRITWSGIALHGGPLPGYAASHGCIRMPYDFAGNLFDKVHVGMRVIVAPDDATPVDFSDPKLFVPNAQALAAAPQRADTLAAEAADAAAAADEAKKAATAAARDAAAVTPAALHKLELAKSRADAELALTDKMIAAPSTAPRNDQEKAKAEDYRQKLAAKAADLGTQLDTAKADAQAKRDAAAAAQAALKAADAKKAETAAAARDAKLALEPVSVFISRKTQKLYVRRGWQSTLEVPVTIRDPDKPIGTHVFTAVARNDDGSLRWTAVTIDNGDDAKDALDRIDIPPEALAQIAPTAVPRSSLIISDEPANREQNYRTEFVVVLNDQPQGGLAIRKPATDMVAGRDGWYGGGSYYPQQQYGYRQYGGNYGGNYYYRRW